MKFARRTLCLSLGAAALMPLASWAQDWPGKQPIRIVVPFPAGGTSDVLARLISLKMTEKLGQTVLVENRAGNAGNLGADLVAKSPADGYTFVLMDVGNLTISPALYKLPFDVIKDFVPVAMVGYSPHLLVVSTKVPASNIAELVKYAKANPGKLNFAAAAGMGSDTCGSIRIPAAFNGVVGYKTSTGHHPMGGVFPLSPTLDTLGPLARTVEDCVLVDAVLRGLRQPEAMAADPGSLDFVIPDTVMFDDLAPALEALQQTSDRQLDISLQQNRQHGWQLDICDNGPGISEQVAKQIFIPFFTTKTQGSGIGLSLSRALLQAQDAQLQYVPGPAPGSCFRITFKT